MSPKDFVNEDLGSGKNEELWAIEHQKPAFSFSQDLRNIVDGLVVTYVIFRKEAEKKGIEWDIPDISDALIEAIDVDDIQAATSVAYAMSRSVDISEVVTAHRDMDSLVEFVSYLGGLLDLQKVVLAEIEAYTGNATPS